MSPQRSVWTVRETLRAGNTGLSDFPIPKALQGTFRGERNGLLQSSELSQADK